MKQGITGQTQKKATGQQPLRGRTHSDQRTRGQKGTVKGDHTSPTKKLQCKYEGSLNPSPGNKELNNWTHTKMRTKDNLSARSKPITHANLVVQFLVHTERCDQAQPH